MPTDLECKTCKGEAKVPTDNVFLDFPIFRDCPDCAGSGVAAWAVETGVTIMVGAFDRPPITAKIEVQTVLAAVREEAKKHEKSDA